MATFRTEYRRALTRRWRVLWEFDNESAAVRFADWCNARGLFGSTVLVRRIG